MSSTIGEREVREILEELRLRRKTRAYRLKHQTRNVTLDELRERMYVRCIARAERRSHYPSLCEIYARFEEIDDENAIYTLGKMVDKNK